ncbi:MAG: hypothetical protein Q8930_06845 [Bacillota bacterium]|nr:hypothetical protein [Bacillota bacterium]
MKINKHLNKTRITILLVCLFFAFLIGKALFVRPFIGMADNGDFFREMNNSGLYYLTDNFNDRHFGYFNRLYGIRQYRVDNGTIIITSVSFLIRIAVAVNKIFISSSIFDIRILAAIYFLLFIFAFYSIISDISRLIKLPVIITAVSAIVIFGDIGYMAYFNSFYGEPASFVFFFLLLAFLLRLLGKQRLTIINLLGFLFSALIFVTAKQQNAPVTVVILILSIRLSALRKDKLWRLVILCFSVIIIGSSAFVYFSTSKDIAHINQYHSLTRGVLENSADIQKDTEEVGLDSKYSMLQGTTYYDRYSLEAPESDQMNDEFYSKYGIPSIMRYYLNHPDRLNEKLNIAAKNSFTIRPEVLGNFEKSEGKSYVSKASTFSLWSTMKEKIFPHSFKFILLFYFIYFGGLSKLYIDNYKRRDTRAMIRLEAFGAVALMGMMQFGISSIGAGDADLAKHLFLFNVCYDFMFLSELVFIEDFIYSKLRLKERVGEIIWKQKRLISG